MTITRDPVRDAHLASRPSSDITRAPFSRAAIGVQLLSGVAGLGYELIWTEQLGTALGHEHVAALAVVAAFFAGLGVGGVTLGRAIEQSARPAVWYAACEVVIALWALVLRAYMPAASSLVASIIGAAPSPLWHWTVAFAAPCLLLAPATCAMGATLPAVERAIATTRGTAISALYAANTMGAVLGVLGAACFLVPRLGLSGALAVCAMLNLTCALLGSTLFPRALAVRSSEPARSRIPLLLFATGALGVGYEVVGLRILAQRTENTLYTFAVALAVYLLGSACGAAAYPRARLRRAARGALLLSASFACLIGAATLGFADAWRPTTSAWLRALLSEPGASLASEALAAGCAFFLPAAAMGACFTHLCVEARDDGVPLGRLLAANTLGGAVAPFFFGVGLVPTLGAGVALKLGTVGYALLAWPRRPRALLVASGVLALTVGLPFAPSPLVPVGAHLIASYEGVAARVSVIGHADGSSTLHIDDRQREGSSATLLSDARQAWLPLLLHADPKSALFLGLGSGVTAGSATWAPHLDVEAVELSPEVVAASHHFDAGWKSDRTPTVRVADARRFVRASTRRYDVIIADLFHPARSGSGALYTREHFTAVSERLAPNGLFCQWLPIHQLDLRTLRSIIATFLDVFPSATALLATNSLDTPVLGLIAPKVGPNRFDAQTIRARLDAAREHVPLRALHLEDELAVLGSFVADTRDLQRFAAGATLNTDDRPFVSQHAPLATYASIEASSATRARLFTLLAAWSPDELLAGNESEASRARLTDYARARRRFLEVGTDVHPDANARAMLAQVRTPLLSILRLSPDFRPAYDPLLEMAQALPSADEARALLNELAVIQPARPEAGSLLRRIAGTSGALLPKSAPQL